MKEPIGVRHEMFMERLMRHSQSKYMVRHKPFTQSRLKKYFDVGNSKNLINLFGQLLCKVNMKVSTAATKIKCVTITMICKLARSAKGFMS